MSMSRESHAGFSRHPPRLRLLQLVRRNAAHLRTAMLDGRPERAADRSPERNQHPLHALWILPGRHGSPHALRVERLVVVAEQRRRVERRAVVVAAERVTVEEPEAALLARPDEELPAAMIERHRRDVHVEIAGAHPVGVRRREPVDELQLLIRVDLDADDRVAEAARCRVVAWRRRSPCRRCLPAIRPRHGAPTCHRLPDGTCSPCESPGRRNRRRSARRRTPVPSPCRRRH